MYYDGKIYPTTRLRDYLQGLPRQSCIQLCDMLGDTIVTYDAPARVPEFFHQCEISAVADWHSDCDDLYRIELFDVKA